MSEAIAIRRFQPEDLPTLQSITVDAFDGVSIDRNTEDRFGVINQRDWKWRKARHIAADAEREPTGIFVAETAAGRIVGYITTWCDREAGIGNIPNLALDAAFRGRQSRNQSFMVVTLQPAWRKASRK